MSTPADQMGAAPPGGVTGGGEPPPGAAPTMTPQDNKGEKASAHAAVAVARRMIEHSIPVFGTHTKEGQALAEIAVKIAKVFGKDEDQAEEIMPAELKTALMAGGGGGAAPDGAAPPPAAAAA